MGTSLRRRIAAAAAAAFAVVATALVALAPPEAPVTALQLGTGLPGGVYHAFGQALQEVTAESRSPVVARETPASVANLEAVAAGELDVAFTMADVAALAVAGEAPFAERLPVAAVARLYDNHTHLVVRAGADHRQLGDLAGATVSVGASGSGTEMIAERLLTQAGLTSGAQPVQVVQLGLLESGEALAAQEIDAFFWSGGLPTQAVAELAARTPVRLIDLAEWVAPLSRAHGEHFAEIPVQAGTYPGVPGVRTVGVPSLLVVHRDMPVPVAHALTRELFAAREQLVAHHPVALQLTPRSAISTLPVPLHPGAARYYEDVKVAHRPGG